MQQRVSTEALLKHAFSAHALKAFLFKPALRSSAGECLSCRLPMTVVTGAPLAKLTAAILSRCGQRADCQAMRWKSFLAMFNRFIICSAVLGIACTLTANIRRKKSCLGSFLAFTSANLALFGAATVFVSAGIDFNFGADFYKWRHGNFETRR